MQQVIESFSQFVADNPLIVLGIMAVAAILLIIDREMTFLCPVDEKVMSRLKGGGYRCPKCGFTKGG